ncbi:hypothetical protein DPMN_004366 [Dreissena polymorpha]|uniref:Cadherin domain-containing protein n=1 Tax=Dreissena polymorpha TaxID=45954 RepID=A0A9D4MSJ3_DREPO|nr:hypothetical protein DPMN_004366 [Dreissena polymorpha]
MTLKIEDNGLTPRSATITATVTISDINDKLPIFQSTPYTFTVSEHVPASTLIDRVTATDADINLNGAVTFEVAYFITGDSNHITLDASSGALTTATTLDREAMDLYVLVIRAKDGGAGPLTATATVSIRVLDYNDNAPTFSSALYVGTVTENTVAGTSILTVVIDDLDIDNNDGITLSISDTNADMYIAADSTTYVLSVKTPIDREVFTQFEFVLTATDAGTPALTATTTVRITVLDVNDNEPLFSPTFYSSEIAYNDDCQVTITTLTANDADESVNADLTFAFTQNDNPELFSLNTNTGSKHLFILAFLNFNSLAIIIHETIET